MATLLSFANYSIIPNCTASFIASSNDIIKYVTAMVYCVYCTLSVSVQ